MKVNVKYKYNVEYLPTKRHRKPRRATLTATHEVTIPEVSIEDFPVAIIVREMKSVAEGMTSYWDYDDSKCEYKSFAEELRTYNGILYAPIRVTHGACISTVFESLDTIVKTIERHAKNFLYDYNSYVDEMESLPPEAILLHSMQDEAINALVNDAMTYIYSDGKFWTVTAEPRYVINTFGLGHNHGGTSMFIEYGYNPNISNKNYFNALHREEAIAYGKAVAARRGDTESVDNIGKYDNIEVLMPEVIHVEPMEQHGEGDKFTNDLEELIDASDSVLTAGLFCIAHALKGM